MNTHVSEIAARAKAATAGEWLARDGQASGYVVVAENPQVATILVAVVSSSDKQGRADAEFMAYAKRDIDALLAQLEDRDKKLEAVRESIEAQYKDGVCLWSGWRSGGSLEFHCCWVGHFDRILEGGE